ncbi:MAG: 3-hydroxyacyl-CoA dehydrogenase NAD-binding domain-containing protein [Oligoflexales bacterium]
MKHLSIKKDDNQLVIVTFDSPNKEVNTLSREVFEELKTVIDQLKTDPQAKGLIIRSAKKDFIVGADIGDIEKLSSKEEATQAATDGQEVLTDLSELKIPSVAMIHGLCLGGGLELALACRFRVASNDPRTKLGLPEIQLGLIPGCGGTQRLPRLIGIQAAMDMILTGRQVSAKKSKKKELVSEVTPIGRLLEAAHECLSQNKPKIHSQSLPDWAIEGNPIGRKVMMKRARDMIDDKTKGFYPASYKALEAIGDGFDLSIKEGLALEAQLFGELVTTREHQGLVHLFHATTAAKKNIYADATQEVFGSQKTQMVGVFGAGLMGQGISTVSVSKGLRVRLSDPNEENISKALQATKRYLQKKVDKRRIQSFEMKKQLAHLSADTSPQGFEHCDVVIEAVFEDLPLKQKLLKELEEKAHENLIFASNTSAIPIAEIAKKAKHPERVIGMHFFSPVESMPLLEIIRTPQTADWVTGRIVDLGQTMGKQIIVVQDGPGFYTTRALAFYMCEAAQILSEGTPIEILDRCLTRFGFPIGPIALVDEVGIDVAQHVLKTMKEAFPERVIIPDAIDAILASGRLGKKNQKGFYHYKNGHKTRPDDEIYHITKTEISHECDEREIADRCILLFVNESVRCLEENILSSPRDGDIGAVFGLGFPPFLGGPFKYVDLVGASSVVAQLQKFAEQHGPRFAPAKTLVEHAEKNTLFFPEEPGMAFHQR